MIETAEQPKVSSMEVKLSKIQYGALLASKQSKKEASKQSSKKEFQTAEGRTYYYNSESRQTSWKIPEEFSLPPSNSPPQPSPSTRASPPTESTNKARIPEGSTSLAQQLEDAAQLHLESNVEDTASASEISSAFIPSLKGRERVEHFQRLRSLEVSESEDDGDRPPAAGERNSQLEVQCHSEHLILREKSAEEKKSFNMMADNTENLSQSEIRPLSESPAFELEQAISRERNLAREKSRLEEALAEKETAIAIMQRRLKEKKKGKRLMDTTQEDTFGETESGVPCERNHQKRIPPTVSTVKTPTSPKEDRAGDSQEDARDGLIDVESVRSMGDLSAMVRLERGENSATSRTPDAPNKVQPNSDSQRLEASFAEQVTVLTRCLRAEKERASVAEAVVENLRFKLEEKDDQLSSSLAREKERMLELRTVKDGVKAQVKALGAETRFAIDRLEESKAENALLLSRIAVLEGQYTLSAARAREAEAEAEVLASCLEGLQRELDVYKEVELSFQRDRLGEAQTIEKGLRADRTRDSPVQAALDSVRTRRDTRERHRVLSLEELSVVKGFDLDNGDEESPHEKGAPTSVPETSEKDSQRNLRKPPPALWSLKKKKKEEQRQKVATDGKGSVSITDEKGRQRNSDSEAAPSTDNRTVSLPAFKLTGEEGRLQSQKRLLELLSHYELLLQAEREGKAVALNNVKDLSLSLERAIAVNSQLANSLRETQRRDSRQEERAPATSRSSSATAVGVDEWGKGSHQDSYVRLLEQKLQLQNAVSARLAREANRWRHRCLVGDGAMEAKGEPSERERGGGQDSWDFEEPPSEGPAPFAVRMKRGGNSALLSPEKPAPPRSHEVDFRGALPSTTPGDWRESELLQIIDALKEELEEKCLRLELQRADERVLWLELAEKARTFSIQTERMTRTNEILSRENEELRSSILSLTEERLVDRVHH